MQKLRFLILSVTTISVGVCVLLRGEALRPPTESFVRGRLLKARRLSVFVQQSELQHFSFAIDDESVVQQLADAMRFRGQASLVGGKCCGCRPWYSFDLTSIPRVSAIVNHRGDLWLFTPTGLYSVKIDPKFQDDLKDAVDAARRDAEATAR